MHMVKRGETLAEIIAGFLARLPFGQLSEEPCSICSKPTRGRMRVRGVTYVVCDYEEPDSLACRLVWHYRMERDGRENFDAYLIERPVEIDALPDHLPIDDRDSYNDYKSYIRSREWETKAVYAKRRAGWTCEKCGRRYESGELHKLHAHHLHYRTLYKERRQDIQVLCSDCHKQAHGL